MNTLDRIRRSATTGDPRIKKALPIADSALSI